MNYLTLLSLFIVVLAVTNARPYQEEHHAPAKYKFAYGVHDHHTGDHHQHHEESDGHIVRGSYSLREPDGTIRIVDYYAGPHTGFHAVVRRIGHPHHEQQHQVFGGQGGEEQGEEQQQGVEELGGEEQGAAGQGGEEQGGEEQGQYGGQGEESEYRQQGYSEQGGYGEEREYNEQGGLSEQLGGGGQQEEASQSYAGVSQWGYE